MGQLEHFLLLAKQNQLNILFRIVGIPDEYMINGSQSDVLDYYDMEPNKLALIARKLLNR